MSERKIVMDTQNASLFDSGELASSYYAFGDSASANFAISFDRSEEGTATVKNLPIFRAGSFKDSTGMRHEVANSQLEEIVSNFNTLRSSDFPNVPVRTDHSRSVDKVVGYVDALKADGHLLLADFTFTEPTAADKWERRTYRSRSAEVGVYQTNDGVNIDPVLMGFAFVDIPAVEGLFNQSTNPKDTRFFTEVSMTKEKEETVPVVEPVVEPVVIDSTFGKQVETATFTIGGVETTDFAAVQAHIAKMETAANEQRTVARTSFAKGLITDNKLVAPQEVAMTEFALSLDDEQFTKLEAVFAGAPVLPLLADHSAGSVTNPDGSHEPTDAEKAIADAEEIVKMHQRSGMSDDQVKNTASFTKLAALRAEQTK